ncbi:hypothetical protein BSAE_1787 [Bifidobacterium pullorum subsp. saeculare DSM 6531 = LMG 14934]|uniref:Uncharacterized protein n=1 Tax=Bifidobacterium pullorum subsp. saeculare DSM 6531 = LMG 14934 TaxID=1437611 RepID=A0A087CY00_9BIFI|nr:hypothetical protein BSAE_1787 [Bifidobacterium pullorum subsp. saeculare DSM 6531 = LMG 14934]
MLCLSPFLRYGLLRVAAGFGLCGFKRLFGSMQRAFALDQLSIGFGQLVLRFANFIALPFRFILLFGDTVQPGQCFVGMVDGVLRLFDAVALSGISFHFQLGLNAFELSLCSMQIFRALFGAFLRGLHRTFVKCILRNLIGIGMRGAATDRTRLPLFQHAGVFCCVQHGERLTILFGLMLRLFAGKGQFGDFGILLDDAPLKFGYVLGVSKPLFSLFTLVLQ